MRNDDEAKWSVIANGRSIANGTTIRRNGVVSHYTETVPANDENNNSNSREPRPRSETMPEDDDSSDANDDVNDDVASDLGEKSPNQQCPVLKVNTAGARASMEALTTVLHQLRWRESKGNVRAVGSSADLYWHGPGFEESLYSKPGVYAVNKLPGIVELSQKVHLSRIIKRMQFLFPGEFDFYPPTWFLPEQYHQFVAEVTLKNKSKSTNFPVNPHAHVKTPTSFRALSTQRNRKEQQTYIVKPDNGSQGEGIYLVNDPRDVQEAIGSRPAIVQKYIDDPLLLDNFKFDLRMYVLIARLHPIEIYLCKDGLARLCTVEYESPNTSNLHNTFMHLTNYSLNKFSEDFIQTSAENTGSKRTYRSVKQILRKQGHNVDKIHKQIVDLVVKTVLSLLPDITIWDHVTNRSRLVRSFQILGFDILLTSDLKAHLLEVNSSPSMGIDAEQETEPGSGILESITSVVDEQIKVPLLRDALRLIAYGEEGINMAKCCLQRVYPSPSKPVNQTSPRPHPASSTQMPRKIERNDAHQRSSRRTPEYKSIGTKNSLKDITLSPFDCIENNVIPDVAKYNEGNSTSRDRKFGQIDHQENFDNPLLRPDVLTRPRYPAKRTKRLTVIKYRQEYAISTEEWRLFQSRSKLSKALVNSRNGNYRDQIAKPPQSVLTPRSQSSQHGMQEDKSPSHFPRLNEELEYSTHCSVCGSYQGGVGPGLLRAQQRYKASCEQAQHASKMKPLAQIVPQGLASNFDEKPFLPQQPEANRSSSEWENDYRTFYRCSLPPRSIYFSSAQQETKDVFATGRDRSSDLTFSPDVGREGLGRISYPQKQLCDICSESSTASTASEDLTYKSKLKSTNERARKSRGKCESTAQVERRESFAVREIMLMKRAAAVFIFFNGIKPSLRINATAFRNMARRCRLCEQGAMPAIDILFIDTMRQWQRQVSDHSSPYYDSFRGRNPITSHQGLGLPFQGFVEALFRIAKAGFKGATLKEKMEALISNCETYMQEASRADKAARRRKENNVLKKAAMSPRISCGMSQRQPYYYVQ